MVAKLDNVTALAVGVGVGTLFTWLAIRRNKSQEDSRAASKETNDKRGFPTEVDTYSTESLDHSYSNSGRFSGNVCAPYVPPSWVASHPSLRQPSKRLRLAHLPTPLHR